jgi:hypothetical protein
MKRTFGSELATHQGEENTAEDIKSPHACYTPEQFRQIYQIGRTSYYKEVNTGRLTLKKIGHLRRIDVKEAERWWRNLEVRKHAGG